MRTVALGLAVATAALLQTAVMPHLSVAGYRADLLLLLVALVALEDGPAAGTRVGIAAGLATDLLDSASPVGTHVLVLSVVGYAVGVLRPYLSAGRLTAPLGVAFGATLLGTTAAGLLTRMLGGAPVAVDVVLRAALVVALYDTLLAPLAVWVVRRITTRFPLEPAVRL